VVRVRRTDVLDVIVHMVLLADLDGEGPAIRVVLVRVLTTLSLGFLRLGAAFVFGAARRRHGSRSNCGYA
jgi:hypothetical protein